MRRAAGVYECLAKCTVRVWPPSSQFGSNLADFGQSAWICGNNDEVGQSLLEFAKRLADPRQTLTEVGRRSGELWCVKVGSMLVEFGASHSAPRLIDFGRLLPGQFGSMLGQCWSTSSLAVSRTMLVEFGRWRATHGDLADFGQHLANFGHFRALLVKLGRTTTPHTQDNAACLGSCARCGVLRGVCVCGVACGVYLLLLLLPALLRGSCRVWPG